jgi:predicted Rossmann fold flavoprotein
MAIQLREKKQYDVIIIGGGAAGIMAAISAKKHHPDYSVAILDRTFALGRKILVAGAGRCNVTNINLDKSAESRYYGASHDFVKSVFEQFTYDQIVEFFDELGIELYVERKTQIGKLFPVTDQAKTVTNLLEDELNRLGVEIFLNTEVSSVQRQGEDFVLKAKKIENNVPVGGDLTFTSEYLVLSAGGKTYPALGSNGSGYILAESLGHRIIGPVPSALPLVGKNPISQEANGTKMEIEVTSIIDGKEVKTTADDVMFTQYGLSGPAILNVSREISIQLNRYNKGSILVRLNFFPGKTEGETLTMLKDRWIRRPNQSVEMSLNGLLAPKLPPVLLKILHIPANKHVSQLTEKEQESLARLLSNYKVAITETRGWNEAEFTAGGVDTLEVKTGTLESSKVPHLYFAGEILDVDGDVGGFNLSWAWSSGFVVGRLA